MTILAAILVLVCFFRARAVAGNDTNIPFPGVVAGALNLTGHDLYQDGNIRLDGQWQFFLDGVLSPAAFAKAGAPQPDGFYPVPGYWTSYEGLSLPPEGDVTYRLLINVQKKGRPLSLSIPEIFTEYRLFVNGQLIDNHGRFSGDSIRFLSPRIFTFYNNRDTIEILINIANQHHANAGIGQSFFLGSPENIHKQYRLNTLIEMILVAVCLFAGIYHCILFSLRHSEKDLLFFGLFCMLLAARTLFIVAQSVMLAIKFANEHKMVEALSQRLQISDRLKDEFLANTSHELRTPLNGIIGICDSLIDGIAGSLPDRTRANLKLISSSARRLASLIDDILDYARLKTRDITLSLKDIDLRQITEVVLAILKATSPSKNVERINDVSSDFPTVRGDENRVQQILFNLIGNAVKFTEKGTIRVFAVDKGSLVMVHIQDTGKGIPADRVDDIFRSFEQVDGIRVRNHCGSGLGLPITRKLVELQGGTIHVRSIENRGSTFSFTFQK